MLLSYTVTTRVVLHQTTIILMLQRHQVYLSNYLVISGKSPREYHAVDLSSIGVVQDSQHGFYETALLFD